MIRQYNHIIKKKNTQKQCEDIAGIKKTYMMKGNLMKITTTANEIHVTLMHKTMNILIWGYEYKKLNGFFKIEIPVTPLNAHFKVGDTAVFSLSILCEKGEAEDEQT